MLLGRERREIGRLDWHVTASGSTFSNKLESVGGGSRSIVVRDVEKYVKKDERLAAACDFDPRKRNGESEE